MFVFGGFYCRFISCIRPEIPALYSIREPLVELLPYNGWNPHSTRLHWVVHPRVVQKMTVQRDNVPELYRLFVRQPHTWWWEKSTALFWSATPYGLYIAKQTQNF